MTRRRRRRPGGNSGVQLIQILGLAVVLVMILLFRDQIAGGAGDFFSGFGSEDVQLPEERKANVSEQQAQSDAGVTQQPSAPDASR